MSRIRTLAALLAAGLLLLAPAASGASSSLVVSQVYGGGGNVGATYANDFVELLNRGSTAVDLTGWTLQYAPSTSTSWQVTELSGTVQPGHYFLVQLASAGGGGASLPAPDDTGTSNVAASGGKVAVVHDAVALTCGGSPGSCAGVASVVDLVGWGSASDYEGPEAVAALDAVTAAVRGAAGCTDTDANAADFTVEAPSPRHSSSPAATCGSAEPPSGALQDAGVDVDVQPVLSLSLEHPTLSFGAAGAGDTPTPISEQLTVVSNNAAGYSLTVHRTAFSPADLPLGASASAPSGAQLGSAFAGGGLVAIPIDPSPDLVIGTTAAQSAAGGDAWPTAVGFVSALPLVPPGHYTATVTYTLVGR